MTCCHCQAAERQFGESLAKKDRKRYRRKGPDKTTRQILAALRAAGLEGASLLDVGGGVGVIHHEILGEGVSTAVHVEAAPAYLIEAKAEARSRGHDQRVEFVHGDFVDLEPELPECDVVTLDRVVCCYPELEPLVAGSAGKARRLWAATYPRDSWWTRAGNRLENLVRRLTGNPFRTYVHPCGRIEEILTDAGFGPAYRNVGFVWEAAVYERRRIPKPLRRASAAHSSEKKAPP